MRFKNLKLRVSLAKEKLKLSGFTLTELLIVVSIIAFLSVLITAYLRTQIFKGYDARRKAEARRIGIAAEEYEKDNDCYPMPNLLGCDPGDGLKPYMDKIPCDPLTGKSYEYQIENSVCPSWYRVYTELDNTSDKDFLGYIGPNNVFNYVYSSPNAPDITGLDEPPGDDTPPTSRMWGCFNGVCNEVYPDPVTKKYCEVHYENENCYGFCALHPEIVCK